MCKSQVPELVLEASHTVLPRRHSSDRVNQLEALVETYKRKLEDLGDLRRQVRLLEERNTVYMQRTCELEEELRRANAVRNQLDTYKRQASCGQKEGGRVILVPVLTSSDVKHSLACARVWKTLQLLWGALANADCCYAL